MDHFARSSDLTAAELVCLRHIIACSFVSKGAVSIIRRERLQSMGLISFGMGGLMPTPTGRIVARSMS
jgi:hypothetical protein